MAEPRSERSLEILAALEPLLDQALELGPAERELWLADLRADRPDVAEELERLLAAEEELDQRGFLDHGSAVSLKAGGSGVVFPDSCGPGATRRPRI